MMRRKDEKKWKRRRRGVGRSSGGKKMGGRNLVVNVSMKVKDCLTAKAFLENCFGLSDDLLDP